MSSVRPPDVATAPGSLRRLVDDAALAVGFLTILPVPAVDPGPRGLGRAAGWFPLAGALVGALAGGVRAGAQPLVGATTATVLAVVTLVAVTGALHQDGLADTADGLGARGGGRDRRLAAMRDSAIGTFGVLALIGWTLLLVAALAGLSDAHALAALIAAGATARWAALLHAIGTAPARGDGLGAGFDITRSALSAASPLAIAAAVLACRPLGGVLALSAAAATAALTTLYARRLLGGRTGDTLGATIALAEITVCVALAGWWS